MSFDWADYLTLAQELINQTDNSDREARFRAAISRAYYAAFCKARNFVLEKDKNTTFSKTGEAHKEVQRLYRGSNSQHQNIAWKLNQLQIQRERADYEDDFDDLEDQAETTLELAKYVITNLTGSPPKQQPKRRL